MASPQFNKLPVTQKISLAKEKTKQVVDNLLYLLELHETNAIVTYSPLLSAQIPVSFAAHAFNAFQRGLHQIEIVRLCALWDSVDIDKNNVPTIVALIDTNEVIEALALETAAHWEGIEGKLLNLSDDPELSKIELEAYQRSNQEFARQQADRARTELREAIHQTRKILNSSQYHSLMNLRDKHLAHSLSETRREKKVGTLPSLKYGDERDILNSTFQVAEKLYCWVNGIGFSFEDSRAIHRRHAAALWNGCTFEVIE